MQLSENSNFLQTNFFLDNFYHLKQEKDFIIQYRNHLLKLVLNVLKKVSIKINHMNDKLKECNNMDIYRIYGELLTANLYQIDNHFHTDSITLENYYQNNEPIIIPLDKSISPSLNAKKYFKKYSKLKSTLSIVSIQKEEAQKELDYLESIIYELENVEGIRDLDDIYHEIYENVLFKQNVSEASIKKEKMDRKKSHDVYEPITYQINGSTLYVGKNNKQNDYISTKLRKE